MLSLQALMYVEGNDRTGRHPGTDILEGMLTRIALSNSTAGKYAPLQVIKQLEHGRTSTTEKQK